MVGLKIDFDLQITLMAASLYRLMAGKIGREYEGAQAKKIFRNMLDVSANAVISVDEVIVTPDKRAHNPYLVASGLADAPTPMPGLGIDVLSLALLNPRNSPVLIISITVEIEASSNEKNQASEKGNWLSKNCEIGRFAPRSLPSQHPNSGASPAPLPLKALAQLSAFFACANCDK
jgi:hypothetical protein